MALNLTTKNNTVDEWRINTNLAATELNKIESGNYQKIANTFTFQNTAVLAIQSEGTALTVQNTVSFATNLEVGKEIALGVREAQTGNLQVGNMTSLYGAGLSLFVANNVLANLNLQVTNNITTSNISTNNDIFVGRNANVINKLSVHNSGNVVFVNTGAAVINTAHLSDTYSTNVKATDVYIYDTLDVVGITTCLSNVYALNLNTTGVANANTLNVSTNGTVFGNLNTGNTVTSGLTHTGALRTTGDANVQASLSVTNNISTSNIVASQLAHVGSIRSTGDGNFQANVNVTSNVTAGNLVTTGLTHTGTLRTSGVANVGSSLSVTNNVSTANIVASELIHTSSLRTTGVANIGSSLSVTSNVTAGNLVTTGLTHTGTLRTTGRADVGGALTATTGDFSGDVSVANNLTVGGNFVLTGDIVYDTDALIISTVTPITSTGAGYFGVFRGNTVSLLGNSGTDGNAYIRWSATSNTWQIRDVFNTNSVTAFSKILTANLISDSLTSTSSDTFASSNVANILSIRSINNGNYANAAYGVANSASSYANGAFQASNSASSYANSAYQTANSASSYANSAFVTANTANTNAISAGSYANSAYAQANTANTNAISAGSYANSAFARANTGNTTATSASSYANSAYQTANSASSYANSAFSTANTASTNALSAGTYANAAFGIANTANTTATSAGSYANSAFSTANNKVSSVSGTTGRITSTGGLTPTLDLATAGPGATSATNSSVTIDAYGRVTALSSGTAPVTSIGNTAPILSSGGTTPTISHAASGVTASTYGNSITVPVFAVNATGHVTSVTDTTIRLGSTAQTGVLQLTDSVSSTSTSTAATPNSVKSAYDLAAGKISSITITNGTGISGGGTGSSFTLSIGQDVGTSADVRFNSIGVGTAAPGSGGIRATGDITAAYSSDERLKTNITKIDNALVKVNALDGVTFNWNELAEGKDKDVREAGVIAQQVKEVLPEVVDERDTGYLAVKYEKIVPLLIEAIKELTKEVNDLKKQLNK